MIRRARNADSESIIALVGEVYREYGDRIFLEGADRDLLDIEGHYHARNGEFVVLDQDGEIAGTHAVLPLDLKDGVITFRRLYIRKELRGLGYGLRLMGWAVDWAKRAGYRSVEFWSDVRFERAHRFFQTFGFTKGEIRDMTDGAMPYSEYHFSMDLTAQDSS